MFLLGRLYPVLALTVLWLCFSPLSLSHSPTLIWVSILIEMTFSISHVLSPPGDTPLPIHEHPVAGLSAGDGAGLRMAPLQEPLRRRTQERRHIRVRAAG